MTGLITVCSELILLFVPQISCMLLPIIPLTAPLCLRNPESHFPFTVGRVYIRIAQLRLVVCLFLASLLCLLDRTALLRHLSSNRTSVQTVGTPSTCGWIPSGGSFEKFPKTSQWCSIIPLLVSRVSWSYPATLWFFSCSSDNSGFTFAWKFVPEFLAPCVLFVGCSTLFVVMKLNNS